MLVVVMVSAGLGVGHTVEHCMPVSYNNTEPSLEAIV